MTEEISLPIWKFSGHDHIIRCDNILFYPVHTVFSLIWLDSAFRTLIFSCEWFYICYFYAFYSWLYIRYGLCSFLTYMPCWSLVESGLICNHTTSFCIYVSKYYMCISLIGLRVLTGTPQYTISLFRDLDLHIYIYITYRLSLI